MKKLIWALPPFLIKNKKFCLFVISSFTALSSYAQNIPVGGGDAAVAAGSSLKVYTNSNGVTGVKLFGNGGTWDTNWGPGYLQLYGSQIYDNGINGLNFANGAHWLNIHSTDASSPVGISLNAAGSSYFNNALAVGGTNGPIHTLHVIGDLTMNNNIDWAQLGITGKTDNQKRLIIGLDTTGNGFGFIKVGRFDKGWTNLIIQPNGGNVGIGTTTPDYKLSVNGNFKVFGFGNPNNYFLYSGGADLDMRCADRGTGGRVFVHDFNNICTINYGGDFTGGTKIGSNAFFSEGTTGISYIKGGYVGIGTSQPDQALTVSGTVHATEVLIDQTVRTPDYVFDKDYDLASLKDVKTYIDQNHHLPEIPSAAQVAKQGINLGEMNAKLLKKIEELTLYLIEEHSKNQNQQQQINDLKVQLKDIRKTPIKKQ